MPAADGSSEMTAGADEHFGRVWTMLIDSFGAETAGNLQAAGIQTMLVKGPVIGEWLYRDSVRTYVDIDLLVDASDWDRAVGVLEGMGLQDVLGPMAHPRMESQSGTAFKGGNHVEAIDLHSTLDGLEAPAGQVSAALFRDARRQVLSGREVAVPSRAAVLMHIALHAVHHVEGKPIADLERGLAIASEAEWHAAADLARELEGLDAFASGLRLLPAGAQLAERLGVAQHGSVHFDLRAAQVPLAEGLDELLAPGIGTAARLSIIRRELFPPEEFMRWWTSLARRGQRGMIASYPWRWLWLAFKLPRGLATLLAARRRRADRPPSS